MEEVVQTRGQALRSAIWSAIMTLILGCVVGLGVSTLLVGVAYVIDCEMLGTDGPPQRAKVLSRPPYNPQGYGMYQFFLIVLVDDEAKVVAASPEAYYSDSNCVDVRQVLGGVTNRSWYLEAFRPCQSLMMRPTKSDYFDTPKMLTALSQPAIEVRWTPNRIHSSYDTGADDCPLLDYLRQTDRSTAYLSWSSRRMETCFEAISNCYSFGRGCRHIPGHDLCSGVSQVSY